MIVSDTRKFVFIHNPKCAGTTVRRALLRYDTTNNFFWMFHQVGDRRIDKAHLPMSELASLFPEFFERLQTHFTFVAVRHPYSRTISAFNEIRSKQPGATDPAEEIRTAPEAYAESLNAFIAALDPEGLDGWNTRQRHFVRQKDMAYLGAECMVDSILKVEDLAGTSAGLGAYDPELRDLVLRAPRRNSREVPLGPMELLSRASIDRINTIYADDFRLFDYGMW